MSASQTSAVPLDGKTRVQLDFTPAVMERINRAMDICELENRKDLFNNALSLLDWAIGEVRKGRVIASVDEANAHYTRLAMPALQNAANYWERAKLVAAIS